MDYTGCGNTLNVRQPRTVQLLMDSLRYWVLEMHVDGFRFDLASALARGSLGVDRLSTFFEVVHQDPVISQVKLIAEPWDIGEGGYQVGNFPVGWAEWNGRYRDAFRRFWRGDPGQVADLAYRLTGSSDLYQDDGRRPYASVNFVTAHDGFTLADLVSYNTKHNEANDEENRDGTNDNLSWNCGAEGETDDPAILALRERQQRNFLGTLFLSQGVPMLCGGDESGRTQRGNNNAYCQDNETSWLDWDLDERARRLLELFKLSAPAREHVQGPDHDYLRTAPRAGYSGGMVLALRPLRLHTRAMAVVLVALTALACAGNVARAGEVTMSGQDCFGPGCEQRITCARPDQAPAPSKECAVPLTTLASTASGMLPPENETTPAPPILDTPNSLAFCPLAPRSPPAC